VGRTTSLRTDRALLASPKPGVDSWWCLNPPVHSKSNHARVSPQHLLHIAAVVSEKSQGEHAGDEACLLPADTQRRGCIHSNPGLALEPRCTHRGVRSRGGPYLMLHLPKSCPYRHGHGRGRSLRRAEVWANHTFHVLTEAGEKEERCRPKSGHLVKFKNQACK